jgi:AAA+ ATPase superfamily predicted ATPase
MEDFPMELPFTNRTDELKELDAAAKAGGLLVVFGRRRVGKTRLLRSVLSRENKKSAYFRFWPLVKIARSNPGWGCWR